LRGRREGQVDEAEGGLQRGQVEHGASMRDRPALGKPKPRACCIRIRSRTLL
jgi:hypothetical protein